LEAGLCAGGVTGAAEMQLDAKPLKQATQWVESMRKFWEGSLIVWPLLEKPKTPRKKINNYEQRPLASPAHFIAAG
jgi:hypothetical protein